MATATATLNSEYLTPSQAGRRVGLSPQRITQLAKAGRLAFVQTPYGRLIDAAAVEALAAERQAVHKADGASQTVAERI